MAPHHQCKATSLAFVLARLSCDCPGVLRITKPIESSITSGRRLPEKRHTPSSPQYIFRRLALSCSSQDRPHLHPHSSAGFKHHINLFGTCAALTLIDNLASKLCHASRASTTIQEEEVLDRRRSRRRWLGSWSWVGRRPARAERIGPVIYRYSFLLARRRGLPTFYDLVARFDKACRKRDADVLSQKST